MPNDERLTTMVLLQHKLSVKLSQRQILTPGLVQAVYGGRVSDAMLSGAGAYVHPQGDTNWWIPSGRVFYSPGAVDTPAVELAAITSRGGIT